VGDDAQSIYAFRGSTIKNILSFPEQFAECKVIKLEENYRSTQPILNLANEILKRGSTLGKRQ
jgi:DNA helicase-2/ATP-dependent DNA helicase PcrA